ncbi:MAG: ATP-binding cassette domain-containing protein, partial [Phycisphaerales bacterium]
MLRLDAVRKTFNPGTANEVRALVGVTLAFAPGSFTVVIGTNGSGKSTLQGAVSGAFELDAGTISVDGRDITRWPEHRRAPRSRGARVRHRPRLEASARFSATVRPGAVPANGSWKTRPTRCARRCSGQRVMSRPSIEMLPSSSSKAPLT